MADYAKDVLVETQWLEQHLDADSIRIVEVDENPALYAEAHIPGAVGFDWKRDLQDQVKRDFLGPEEFGELFGSRGISNDHQIILYGDRNNWFAAYTYWYLKYYGHDNVKLLNGPRDRWISEGRPTTTDAPSFDPATFDARPGDESIRARRDEVLAALGDSQELVDVRSPQEYSGELIAMPGYENEGAQRAGHIPGAKSIPSAQAAAPVARDELSQRQLDDLGDLARAGRPAATRLDQPDERVHRIARRDRRRGLKRTDHLNRVSWQPDLLLGLPERGGAQVRLAFVVAPTRERDLAAVAAQVVPAFGEHGMELPSVEVQGHQHRGIRATADVQRQSLLGWEQHALKLVVNRLAGPVHCEPGLPARRHPLRRMTLRDAGPVLDWVRGTDNVHPRGRVAR